MDDFLQEVKDVFSYLVDDGVVSIKTFGTASYSLILKLEISDEKNYILKNKI